MKSSRLLAICILLLSHNAFAVESDAVLSEKIIGHWGTGRSELFFHRNHQVTYSNFKAPGQDKHGTWAITDGWLDISFWRQYPKERVSFIVDTGMLNGMPVSHPSMRLMDAGGGHRDWLKE
jgi:hypothetical protein